MRQARGSLSSLNTQGTGGFNIHRSVSGNNLYIDDSGSLIHRGDTSFKGSTSTIDQEYNSTPSPSDSAVGDLETVLKEKDNEIIYLRETMEQNEQVIFKVSDGKGIFGKQTLLCIFQYLINILFSEQNRKLTADLNSSV